jgi:hypothetical protein
MKDGELNGSNHSVDVRLHTLISARITRDYLVLVLHKFCSLLSISTAHQENAIHVSVFKQ